MSLAFVAWMEGIAVTELIGIFATVLLAELGDKTQLATLLFAAQSRHHPLLIFLAAAGALCLSTAAAVAVGQIGGQFLMKLPLKPIAGLGFILLGAWTIFDYYRG
jgi:putative Ca2+/H+ antiporter (TMEM165/GDT1 family)